MPMPHCRGSCERSDFPYKTTKKATYSNGFLRCGSCNISIQCNLIKCPCCNTDLRRKPRHTRTRKRMLEEVKRH